MLCEQCFLRNALVHITNIRGGAMTTRHLCQDCAAEEPFGLVNMGRIMQGMVFLIEHATETKQKTRPKIQKDLQCPQCLYHAANFQKTQKLGCPACYEVFREYLDPKELTPPPPSSLPPLPRALIDAAPANKAVETAAARWEQLQSRLYQALKAENFEEAAKLREQLRVSGGSN